MGFSFGKSSRWAIAAGISANYAYGGAVAIYAVALLDVQNQIFFNGVLAGSGAGIGGKAKGKLTAARGLSLASPSWTFFTVANPMYASDFDNSVCALGDVSAGLGIGYSGTALTIFGVSHSPSFLNLSGLNLSLGASAIGLIMYLYVADTAIQTLGCAITPDGDPLCGGSSTMPPNQSTDPGMSQ